MPFNSDAALHSFPSGHTARVFALATLYSLHLGSEAPWVPWVADSLATWTATTRVMDGSHWLTDVTAGAFVGVVTTRLVERLVHQAERGSRLSIALFLLPDERLGLGVRIGLR